MVFVSVDNCGYASVMATTQEIIDAAGDLGKKIAEHDTARKLEGIVKQLQEDIEAQRLLADYQRQITALGEKEAQGQPIEVEDKQQLEALQGQMIRHALLKDFQMAQMDYLDLMRQVDAAISGSPDDGPAPAQSPLVNPDISGGV